MTGNFQTIIKGKQPVLVDFSAEWCGPCKMMGPVLEQLKSKMGDKIRILKIDVDDNRDLAFKYNIRIVPTLMLFQDGITKWSGSGMMTSDTIERAVYGNARVVSGQE